MRACAPYPTWRAAGLMAAGAPVAVALSVAFGPGLWAAGAAWIAAVGSALLIDAVIGPTPADLRLAVEAPSTLEAGGPGGSVEVTCEGPHPALELALEAGALLEVLPMRQGMPTSRGMAAFFMRPRRRGRVTLQGVHVRWRGPLGLCWKHGVQHLGRTIDVLPNVSAVREEALRLFSHAREAGTAAQLDRASSMEFHALKEFKAGDDSRSVNWRQSARHRTLLVSETRAERNRTLVFAFDAGRLMCEPLGDRLPRIDHAINAALLMAYVALKAGDRVGLFAFDARPRAFSPAAGGVRAFAALQHAAAGIDYATEETNFALGLSRLKAGLGGRALVVLFTEFADAVGASLMLEGVGLLLGRHAVLFVAFQDRELEGLVRAEPREAADVSRAVVAGALLREREAVLARLRRLGVEVLDLPAGKAGAALLGRYLDLKRREGL